MNLNIFIDYHFNSVSSRPMNNMILINNESPGTIYVRGLLIDGGDLCAERAGYRSGFSQLKALEFFVFRKMIMPETGNHLLCGWCK